MGLMYQFPIDFEDQDHVVVKNNQVTIRTYGLPPIFWLYGLLCLIMISILTLSVWGPLQKLLSYNDAINNLIGHSLISFLILLPITLISFFFYEKNIILRNDQLIIAHKLFFLPLISKSFNLKDCTFEIKHFLDSPNMARMYNQQEMQGFQNKGHFLLNIHANSNIFTIDRSSRKIDLEKLLAFIKKNENRPH